MFRERQKVERDVELAIMVLASKETAMPSECSACSSWIRADIHCYIWCRNTCLIFNVSSREVQWWMIYSLNFLDINPATISQSSFLLHRSFVDRNCATMDVWYMKFLQRSATGGLFHTLFLHIPAAAHWVSYFRHLASSGNFAINSLFWTSTFAYGFLSLTATTAEVSALLRNVVALFIRHGIIFDVLH